MLQSGSVSVLTRCVGVGARRLSFLFFSFCIFVGFSLSTFLLSGWKTKCRTLIKNGDDTAGRVKGTYYVTDDNWFSARFDIVYVLLFLPPFPSVCVCVVQLVSITQSKRTDRSPSKEHFYTLSQTCRVYFVFLLSCPLISLCWTKQKKKRERKNFIVSIFRKTLIQVWQGPLAYMGCSRMYILASLMARYKDESKENRLVVVVGRKDNREEKREQFWRARRYWYVCIPLSKLICRLAAHTHRLYTSAVESLFSYSSALKL